MLTVTLALFVLAALLGLIVAVQIFKKKETSKPTAITHGLFGAAGLVMLLLYALRQPNPKLTIAIVLLVIAALGGAVLFANDLRKKPGPVALVVIHALAAVVAVGLVAFVALG